ncbi:MAG: 3-phosphoserine/phosphohydroxythreonine transaminase [Gemmatimonadetes bacterium]|nr:MAG: 3-phosphoserine/phosphohydroxythreonine transaminase [Gemmatimonadota bacterium]
MGRVYNFSAGPSTLPLPALEQIQRDFIDYQGTGMGVMEMSHRGKEFKKIFEDTKIMLREVYEIPENFHILFTTGGASMQFAMIPMNFLGEGSADYIDTGSWSSKAIKEAKIQGKSYRVAASTKGEDGVYRRIPKQEELNLDKNARFVHITTNNTIFGTQYHTIPDTGGIPIIADMSSDIMYKKIDFTPFGMIYAGAQKNLGPAGVTLVLLRDDMVDRIADGLPTMLTYKTYIEKDSMFNTPPCFPIYVINEVLRYIQSIGGLDTISAWNKEKFDLIYGKIDEHPDFFKGTAEADSRSWMNVTWRLPNEDLEKAFITEAQAEGLVTLKGHRSVGGLRASIYNAMPVEGVQKLVDFMETFYQKNK